MNRILSIMEFSEEVRRYVKEALPQELAGAEVRVTSLDMWEGGARMALLVIRPWNGVTTGFCLDRWYKGCSDGETAAASAAAAIINDRRLYNLSLDGGSPDGLQDGASIYA